MDIHNTKEEIVINKVTEIFDSLEKEENWENFCTCDQCRMDTACYVLNRTAPLYIVSNRGVVRTELEVHERQQTDADIAAMVYEGLRRVNHNQRITSHGGYKTENIQPDNRPVFNIPTIVGRIFSGVNFAPLSNIKIELRRNGELVAMKNPNWQNPYFVVANTEGTFSFWPKSVRAEVSQSHRIFEYSLYINTPDYAELNHFFKIPVISEIQPAGSFSMDRTFKLPDLYLFPPGAEDTDNFFDFPD
ncbi:MAG: late competence development ComFB family protein [Treponema sp.]|jgi:competence protein ComFB|nr:late competence development ComFB family protein [Treponema sp.]